MSGLQNSHQLEEIAKYLDQMKHQKQKLNAAIRSLEEEKQGVDRQISSLTERRASLTNKLEKQTEALHHLDTTIRDSEATYLKWENNFKDAFNSQEISDTEKRNISTIYWDMLKKEAWSRVVLQHSDN